MNYSPLEDRILVRPIKKSELETTEGGIIVPDSAKKDVKEGEVLAVGEGFTARDTGVFVPTVLGKGDKVLYGAGAGLEIDVQKDETNERETVLIMRETDVLLLISKK